MDYSNTVPCLVFAGGRETDNELLETIDLKTRAAELGIIFVIFCSKFCAPNTMLQHTRGDFVANQTLDSV